MTARRALDDALSVGFAAAAMGLAFGVLVTRSGLSWWWATIFAAVIFAGSLEFLLLGLVTALAPLGQVAAAALPGQLPARVLRAVLPAAPRARRRGQGLRQLRAHRRGLCA